MILRRVKLNYKLLCFMGIVGTNLLLGTLYFGYKIIPEKILDKIWEQKLPINGTEAWNTSFIRQPFPSEFKIFLYDVVNPENIFKGAKPVVKEVGPYVYKLFRWKDNIIIENDTISYYEYETYEFDKESSGQLSDEDDVTILNLPMMSLLYTVETSPFSDYMDAIANSLEMVFGEHNKLFIKTKVKHFLFEGLSLCKREFGSGMIQDMICKQIRERLSFTKQMWESDNGIKFAALRYKNNTHQGYMTVKSGEKNRVESGRLVKINNASTISTWSDFDNNNCNKIKGVTSIFPADLTKDMVFDIFSEDICRSLSLVFNNVENYNGLMAYKFTTEKNSFHYDNNMNQCYCTNKTLDIDENKGCLHNGLLDGTTCTVSIMAFRVLILLTFWWCAALAKVYERCELARELRKLAVPLQEIPTWVCIAQHESLFDSAAMNIGSGDHGLFQISEIYWCSPPGYGCNKPCTAFRDDDISDDVECIRRIYNEHTHLSGDGWNAWVVYPLYCKGDVVHYIQNCDIESMNVTSNVIPHDDTTEKFTDEYGDGYQFPSLPDIKKTQSSNLPVLTSDVNIDNDNDVYQFPPLPIIKGSTKNSFYHFQDEFNKYQNDYEFPQVEVELPPRGASKFEHGYDFSGVKDKIKEQVDFNKKSTKIQQFASKSTRKSETTPKSTVKTRYAVFDETTSKDTTSNQSTSTQSPFTFKMFSLVPFILNGQAVSGNGETVTTRSELKKLAENDIALSESVKTYTSATTRKPSLFANSLSTTTLRSTTPELISIKATSNTPQALALQSLSQVKVETTTKFSRTFKPRTKTTKLFSSKYQTTKILSSSTTEKSFIINTISAFVPKSNRKSSTTNLIKPTTFRPSSRPVFSLNTFTKENSKPPEELISSTPTSSFSSQKSFTSISTNPPSSNLLSDFDEKDSNTITKEGNKSVIDIISSTPKSSVSNENSLLNISSNPPSSNFLPEFMEKESYSFSTSAPSIDFLNSSLRQVTFPSYFPSWFQTLPPVLALPPLPTGRPTSRRPLGPLGTRPTRRTTTPRPLRPLRPLFTQASFKSELPLEETSSNFKNINLGLSVFESDSNKQGQDQLSEPESVLPETLLKSNNLRELPLESKQNTDFFNNIFDSEFKLSSEEGLEEIILDSDYSFYRTKNGYRLFRRSPIKNPVFRRSPIKNPIL